MKIVTLDLPVSDFCSLTGYIQEPSHEMRNAAVRPAILIFPGGGYEFCSDREAEPIALAFAAEGYQSFILRYTTFVENAFTIAFEEANAAIGVMRDEAKSLYLDPNKIAVIGFSAGGHLAAATSSMADNRPNAAILGYPCILTSMNSLLRITAPSLDTEVDELTPPTFIFSTSEDDVVPIENTLAYSSALAAHRIPFETHIFQEGIHGLSLAKPHVSGGKAAKVVPQVSNWFPLATEWLNQLFKNFPIVTEAK